MTGIDPSWFTDRSKFSILALSTLALALTVRVIAVVLVQHALRINARKRRFRYRIPAVSVQRSRGKTSGAAIVFRASSAKSDQEQSNEPPIGRMRKPDPSHASAGDERVR